MRNWDLWSLSPVLSLSDSESKLWSISAILPELNFLQEFHSHYNKEIHLHESLRKLCFPPICLDLPNHKELKQERQENSV